MAYYYVKSGLTGTGDQGRYASQQTGSFPTGTGGYDNIAAAFGATTTPTHGDFICISDASTTHSYSSYDAFPGPTTSGSGLTVISVSDTACQTYSAGAKEVSADGIDLSISGHQNWFGVELTAGDDLFLAGNGSCIRMVDCTISNAGFNDGIIFSGDGATCLFYNHTWNIGGDHSSNVFSFTADVRVEMYDCVFNESVGYDSALFLLGATRTTSLKLVGCDFSDLTSVPYLIDATSWDGSQDRPKNVEIHNCKIPSLTDWAGADPDTLGKTYLITGTSNTSVAQEYQYCYGDGAGRVEETTAIYRDGSQSFPSGQKISLDCNTTTLAAPGRPFVFDFPTRYAELSNTATDTLRLYFMCANALDDGDVWAEVIYPDGTNKHTPNYLSSVTNAFDPFRTAGSLDTNTEAWTGRTTENRYHIDIDTSTDAGADCVPIIRVYVAKASTTIYFCSTVETV